MRRGALIVVEGLDRTGKSTQCRNLVNNLNQILVQAVYMNFPARNTEIGKVIDSYLKSKNELADETIHLLFSANRWEKAAEITNKLEKGITIIVDRYCYSGVAFSAAKGFNLDWCKAPDVGLPKPDKVFFLTMPLDNIQQRVGYGEERYEEKKFQKKVAYTYDKLKDNSWDVINAERDIAKIEEELLKKTLQVVDNVGSEPIGKIWQ